MWTSVNTSNHCCQLDQWIPKIIVVKVVSTYIDSSIISSCTVPDSKQHPSPKHFEVEIRFFLASSINDWVLVHVLVVNILNHVLLRHWRYLLAQEHRQRGMPKKSTRRCIEFVASLRRIFDLKIHFRERNRSLWKRARRSCRSSSKPAKRLFYKPIAHDTEAIFEGRRTDLVQSQRIW